MKRQIILIAICMLLLSSISLASLVMSPIYNQTFEDSNALNDFTFWRIQQCADPGFCYLNITWNNASKDLKILSHTALYGVENHVGWILNNLSFNRTDPISISWLSTQENTGASPSMYETELFIAANNLNDTNISGVITFRGTTGAYPHIRVHSSRSFGEANIWAAGINLTGNSITWALNSGASAGTGFHNNTIELNIAPGSSPKKAGDNITYSPGTISWFRDDVLVNSTTDIFNKTWLNDTYYIKWKFRDYRGGPIYDEFDNLLILRLENVTDLPPFDTIKPTISILDPVNGSTLTRDFINSTITFTANINDTNLDKCWYNHLNQSGYLTSDVLFSCSNGINTFDATVNYFGTHMLFAYANDTSSNLKETNITFIVQETPAQQPQGGGGGGEKYETPVPFFLREKTPDKTCGVDGDQDGILCDPNEDWISCPEDCSAPNLDNLLCLSGSGCVWREAWFLKLLFAMLLIITLYLLYVDYSNPPRLRKVFG